MSSQCKLLSPSAVITSQPTQAEMEADVLV